MSKVTMRHVAEKAGVSISTVSLALRNDERISLETRQAIHDIAREMRYQRDITGTLLRTDKPRILGIVGQLSQELHAEYVDRIHKLASGANFQLIAQDAGVYGGYEGAFSRLAQLRVRNVIAINPCFSAPVTIAVAPSVVIGQTSPFPESDLVRSTNNQGMSECFEHLAQLGHKRALYLDGPAGISATFRRDAMQNAAAANRLVVDVLAAGNTMDDGFKVGRQLAESGTLPATPRRGLPSSNGPTALICYNDQCAQGAIIALNRVGLSVPIDISVVGFDNSSIARSTAFDLTSIDRGVGEVSSLAFSLSIERQMGSKVSPKVAEVPTHLVIRSSTSSARNS
ncbi:LacI family DNA-binding transcriptional regulator [Trueperella pyogenes]|uniref:LacI family DNA-binding transcriptional regulator n=1 Tax=Trueperella pyogenes TaxID=1661 RepID=UPI00345CA734